MVFEEIVQIQFVYIFDFNLFRNYFASVPTITLSQKGA